MRLLFSDEDKSNWTEFYEEYDVRVRIYGDTQFALLKQFRKERHYPQLRSISLSELNEFTYWLFKYRIKKRDKSCMASDTKKALTKLHEILEFKARPLRPSAPEG